MCWFLSLNLMLFGVFFCPSPPLKDIECMAGKTVCIEQLFPMRLGIMFFLLTSLSPKPSEYLKIGLEKKTF